MKSDIQVESNKAVKCKEVVAVWCVACLAEKLRQGCEQVSVSGRGAFMKAMHARSIWHSRQGQTGLC